MKREIEFPQLLQTFFTNYLVTQKCVSHHTIASYRDTFRMLLIFLGKQCRKQPSELRIVDIDGQSILKFLESLEKNRGTSSRSRNQRLAAIRSFFRFVAYQRPDASASIQQILAIPSKRHEKRMVDFLTSDETAAMLAAPDTKTWVGRRDRALLTLAAQTGLRVSELVGLKIADVTITNTAHVRCIGKGRKERCTPLTKTVRNVLRSWMAEVEKFESSHVFPNIRGGVLSSDAVQCLVTKYTRQAQSQCASLAKKNVTPHVLRHTAAMRLLEAGVDRSVIALWLGHESVETTQIYLEADLKMKETALDRTAPTNAHIGRFRAKEPLMEFLTSL